MNSKVIVVHNLKGGVAKTTTVIQMATALVKFHNKKVLVIDCDPQFNTTFTCGVDTNEIRTLWDIFEYYTGQEDAEEVTMDDIIVPTKDGFDLVPGDLELVGADDDYMGVSDNIKTLNKALRDMKKEYDYIIIDTPPSLSLMVKNAYFASPNSQIICPTTLDVYGYQGLDSLQKRLDHFAKKYRMTENHPDFKITGILRTIVESNTKNDQTYSEGIEYFANENNIYCFKEIIHKTTQVKRAQNEMQNLFDYKADSTAAMDYKYFVKELLDLEKKLDKDVR
ncbi:chromosome partitioning protein [Oribacterium sp. KHPX15]|uniref:ParA family protein n=1 Tax=Oribacterium sp. KHPX15 TaxID=1855342 RepID=UPI000896E557|nr:ParA family protein [Oribacterium sp. KHPX15]MBP3818196.1 ParA family protein [Butyrivibrio sp.]SEA80614.1 chromosome partitioning protein [Oribacterium sp. KHPX15]